MSHFNDSLKSSEFLLLLDSLMNICPQTLVLKWLLIIT